MKSKLKKSLPILFYTAIVVFLILYFNSIDFSKFKGAHLAWGYIAIAAVLGLVARYWAILVWFVLLKNLGAENLGKHKGQLIYVFAKSWMGRYIPGTAPWILGKIYFAARHGISKNKLAVSSLLEGGLQIAVTMATAFILLLFDSRLDVISTNFKILMVIALIGCVVGVLPPVFNRIVSLAYKIVRKKTLDREHLASGKTIFRGASLYAVSSLLVGVSLFFITKSVYPSLSFADMPFVMGVANLSGAAGMLAIFVPSGIGIRDGIFLALLSVIMPTEFALLATVASRLFSVVMDFIFFGLSKWIDSALTTADSATQAKV